MTIRKQAYEELREMYLRAGLNPANIRRSEMEARMRVIESRQRLSEVTTAMGLGSLSEKSLSSE